MKYLKNYKLYNEAYQSLGTPLLKLVDNVDKELMSIIESNVNPGGSILEISCGNGADALYLKERGYDVICTEANEGYCENAKSLGLNCIQHDTKDKFTFEDNQFDLIYSRLGLHYFTPNELDSIFDEIGRIGKKLLITIKPESDSLQTGKIFLTPDKWKEIVEKHFKIESFSLKSGILYNVESKWVEIFAIRK